MSINYSATTMPKFAGVNWMVRKYVKGKTFGFRFVTQEGASQFDNLATELIKNFNGDFDKIKEDLHEAVRFVKMTNDIEIVKSKELFDSQKEFRDNYYKENRGRIIERSLDWHRRNREKSIERQKRYMKENKDKINAYQRAYRARKKAERLAAEKGGE